ncbi:hypothetical protein, partial [Nocardia farcinica]|uniref:hypothetical protein n=1 Tax=Nocardia farcinica TaxID=37329 RepID=UPI001C0F332C
VWFRDGRADHPAQSPQQSGGGGGIEKIRGIGQFEWEVTVRIELVGDGELQIEFRHRTVDIDRFEDQAGNRVRAAAEVQIT